MSRSRSPGFAPDWPAPPGVHGWQTTRDGGCSIGAYRSLNLGLHVGDRPGCVDANRKQLRQSLDLPEEPRWLEQVHGGRILRLDRGDAGAADGAVTSQAGVVCAVMTADCLPVLLAERSGRTVGVAHAGWRGLARGVLASAVAAFDCDPGELLAWLGPAIGQAAFEVGDDVRDALASSDASSAAAFTANARGRWQADLYALATLRLEAVGVTAVYGCRSCTYADAERYFSHRREAPCGRMATLIWRQPEAA